jgi:hypothetical protein
MVSTTPLGISKRVMTSLTRARNDAGSRVRSLRMRQCPEQDRFSLNHTVGETGKRAVNRGPASSGQEADGGRSRLINHAIRHMPLDIDKQEMDGQQVTGEGARRGGGFHP